LKAYRTLDTLDHSKRRYPIMKIKKSQDTTYIVDDYKEQFNEERNYDYFKIKKIIKGMNE
jgi:hypothetical protein